ncbi:unnamed protein product [Bursaphelenchus xylophilus]|uniref:(pine wood nematode) hypothetical protein n=1 Tax=Bursaphelenchus xylophilus TaxID=6326 RepID=A0A7I8X3X1_BURXY|nr:unnamed protein product [Bursaphelenchus xylophilus]CAG9128485.1 unnamed protein product [Bursaphelenchus xylophilus]
MALGLQRLGQLVIKIKRLVESAADVELSVQKTGRADAQVQEDPVELRKKLEDIQEALTSAVKEYEEELQTKRDQIEASPDKEDGKAQLEEKLKGSGTEKGYEDAVKAAKEWIAIFDSVAKELVLF